MLTNILKISLDKLPTMFVVSCLLTEADGISMEIGCPQYLVMDVAP